MTSVCTLNCVGLSQLCGYDFHCSYWNSWSIIKCVIKVYEITYSKGVRTQVFSSLTPALIQEVGILILIRILFATQL